MQRVNPLLVFANLLLEQRREYRGRDTELFQAPKRVEVARQRSRGSDNRILELALNLPLDAGHLLVIMPLIVDVFLR